MSDSSLQGAGEHRRGFFATAFAYLVGLFCLAVPTAAGVVTFLNPLRKKERAGPATGEFIRLATLDDLPEDGTPVRVPIVADRVDAWNYFPAQPVGGVWLRRTGPHDVVAFQEDCPHAGCDLKHEPAAGDQPPMFLCPCHGASFDLDGKRLQEDSPSARDLDELDVDIRNGDEVFVKLENFHTGIPEKIVKS
jgi:menaquinol-cytochrome c reductase iron-sulfur subunit